MRIEARGITRSLLTLFVLVAVALEAAVGRSDGSGRHLKFNIGVYDPVGASESSRYSPTRQPVEDDRYVAGKLVSRACSGHRFINPPEKERILRLHCCALDISIDGAFHG